MLPHFLLYLSRYKLQCLLTTPETSAVSHHSTLSQHFRAKSHAYQICQPANGRADEQRENHIKRPWFQPKDYSFNIGIQQKTHLQDFSSKHQESPQQYQEGPVPSLHIKTDSQSVSGGVIWSPTAKGVGLSVPVQKGVTTSLDP